MRQQLKTIWHRYDKLMDALYKAKQSGLINYAEYTDGPIHSLSLTRDRIKTSTKEKIAEVVTNEIRGDFMTDDQKIEKAARQCCDNISDISDYPYTSAKIAFKSGVQWARENPEPIEEHWQDKLIRIATEESIKEREKEMKELREDRERLENKNKIYREALKFYADKKDWHSAIALDDFGTIQEGDLMIVFEKGDDCPWLTAKEALDYNDEQDAARAESGSK